MSGDFEFETRSQARFAGVSPIEMPARGEIEEHTDPRIRLGRDEESRFELGDIVFDQRSHSRRRGSGDPEGLGIGSGRLGRGHFDRPREQKTQPDQIAQRSHYGNSHHRSLHEHEGAVELGRSTHCPLAIGRYGLRTLGHSTPSSRTRRLGRPKPKTTGTTHATHGQSRSKPEDRPQLAAPSNPSSNKTLNFVCQVTEMHRAVSIARGAPERISAVFHCGLDPGAGRGQRSNADDEWDARRVRGGREERSS